MKQSKLLPVLFYNVLPELKHVVYNPITLTAVCKLNGSHVVSRTVAQVIELNSKEPNNGFCLGKVRGELETLLLFSAGVSVCADLPMGGPGWWWVQKFTG